MYTYDPFTAINVHLHITMFMLCPFMIPGKESLWKVLCIVYCRCVGLSK